MAQVCYHRLLLVDRRASYGLTTRRSVAALSDKQDVVDPVLQPYQPFQVVCGLPSRRCKSKQVRNGTNGVTILAHSLEFDV